MVVDIQRLMVHLEKWIYSTFFNILYIPKECISHQGIIALYIVNYKIERGVFPSLSSYGQDPSNFLFFFQSIILGVQGCRPNSKKKKKARKRMQTHFGKCSKFHFYVCVYQESTKSVVLCAFFMIYFFNWLPQSLSFKDEKNAQKPIYHHYL